MFGLFKKKTAIAKEYLVAAPVKGEAVDITEVKDEVFRTEVLGKGVGIIPDAEGKVYAPCAGQLEMVFETGHAFSMTTDHGIELLVHVGIDTVKLKGEHFTVHCKAGDAVKTGDLLLEFNNEAIIGAGYDTTVMVVVCNTDAYKAVQCDTGAKNAGDTVLAVTPLS